jgi:hypothetical protein
VSEMMSVWPAAVERPPPAVSFGGRGKIAPWRPLRRDP